MNTSRISQGQSNLRQVILNFPKQFKPGLEAAEKIKIAGPFDKIVICGMGGSALAGALLQNVVSDLKTPEIFIWRNYGLPANLSSNSLVIAISYSGNTEETLSSFREAANRKLKIIGISTGGRLEELCQKNNFPFISIPIRNIPPRDAIPAMFAILMKIFANAGIIPDQTSLLLETAKNLRPENLEKQGKLIARKIEGKIPIIYSSLKWKELAHNWKFRFNENARLPAFFNVFPELHHNEMATFDAIKPANSLLKNFHVIILEDEKENIRLNEGAKIFAGFVKKRKVPITTIRLVGNNDFEKIFNNLILADWASYWIAVNRGLDPTEVKIIKEFKKIMAS